MLEGPLVNLFENELDEENHGKVRDTVVRQIKTRERNRAAAVFFWCTVAIAKEVQVKPCVHSLRDSWQQLLWAVCELSKEDDGGEGKAACEREYIYYMYHKTCVLHPCCACKRQFRQGG
jgi:hypothetical protein